MSSKIRSFQQQDTTIVQKIYQEAFTGFPWYENLSVKEISNRWQTCITKNGFQCIVIEVGGTVAGALWWDLPTLEQLKEERGDLLFSFAQVRQVTIIWEREVMVSPSLQGRGIGTLLRKRFLEIIDSSFQNFLVLTRMRDDNLGIILIAQKAGFHRTGILIPSSQKPGIYHEYWFLRG